jgi:predicted DNA-binding protein (MmcQ/YjbR family)
MIDTARLKTLCASLAGASATLYQHPSNILVYSVGDKKFAYFKTSDPEKWRFSIRVAPDRFLELTDVPGIKPARYMGRFHWVTIVDPTTLPSGYLSELIEWSYRKALGTLSKQRQAEIAGSPALV